MSDTGGHPVFVKTLAQQMRGGSWRMERLHVQRDPLLLWITRGQGTACLHGIHQGFVMHNAVFVPAGTVFSVEGGRQCLGQTITVPRDLVTSFPTRPALLRVRDQQTQIELATIIEAMQVEQNQPRPYADEVLAAQTALLSVWIRRQAAQPHNPRFGATRAERLVQDFCDLVGRDLRSGQPMAAYAKALDVTPTHLSRVCRQVTGVTAAEILSQCLLYEARLTLGQSQDPIKQIAQGLGFGSAAYFTRFIQQHTGQTPTALRVSESRNAA